MNPSAHASAEPGGARAASDTPDAPFESAPPSSAYIPPVLKSPPPPPAPDEGSDPPPEPYQTIPSAPPTEPEHPKPTPPPEPPEEHWSEPPPEGPPSVVVEVSGGPPGADVDALLDSDGDESSTPDLEVEEATVFRGPLLAPANAEILRGSSGEDPVFPEPVLNEGADTSSPSIERSGPLIQVAVESVLARLGIPEPVAQEFGGKPVAIVRTVHAILVAKTLPEDSIQARNGIVELLQLLDTVYEDAVLIDAPWPHLCRILLAEIGKAEKKSGKGEEIRVALEPQLPATSLPPPPPEPPPPVSKRSKPPPLPKRKRNEK